MNNIKVRNKVRVIEYNVNNSDVMNKNLEEKFPIGSICIVKEVKTPQPPAGFSVKSKNKAKSFLICDAHNLDFCKKVSSDKCITIANDNGDITHICYLSIEKL